MALTDEHIDSLFSEWLYIAPGRTYEEHRPVARAIEAAACADRDARIAELEHKVEILTKCLFQAQEAAKDLAAKNAALAAQQTTAYDRGWAACEATHDGP